MTQPTTTPPPNPPPGDTTDDAVITALVAAILAGWALSKIRDLLQKLRGVESDTVDYMLHKTIFASLLKMDSHTPADPILAAQRRRNIHRRAAYIINAVRRINTAIQADQPGTVRAAWTQELDYLASHLQANHKRNESAIDLARRWKHAGHPDLMGWQAVDDDRTSAECRAANGRNFDPTQVPAIGYPGSVHTHCRCASVAPFNTDARVEDLPDAHMMFDGVING